MDRDASPVSGHADIVVRLDAQVDGAAENRAPTNGVGFFADQPVATYLALLALAQQACAKLWIANVDGN